MSNTGHDNIDRFFALAANASLISDPAEIFRQSRALMLPMIPADHYLIFINDKLRESLIASFAYNTLPSPTEEEISIPYQDILIKDLLISRQTVLRQDFSDALVMDVSQELIVPIITPEEVLGCLYFARLDPLPFTAREVHTAEMAAYLMVAPMERLLWERRTQQTHEILNSFREKYLSILDALPWPAIVFDPADDRIEEVNRAFLEWTGHNRRDLFSRRFSEICRSESRREHMELWPPEAGRVLVAGADEHLLEAQSFSAWLTARMPEKRIVTFTTAAPAGTQAVQAPETETLIRTLSHDLKAPLQSLKGYATLLWEEYGYHFPVAATNYLDRIFANLEQMERLISDLLDLSRASGSDLAFEEVDSFEILKNALESLAGLIEKRPVNLIIDSTLPRITCNQTQMTQVFINLISNALKFTRDSAIPSIEVGCNRSDGDFEFYVKDNGIGIPAQEIDHIFDLFFTRDAGDEGKGTGIGLTIVKRIIERHHGRIWAESQGGQGAVIRFSLPRVLERHAAFAGE